MTKRKKPKAQTAKLNKIIQQQAKLLKSEERMQKKATHIEQLEKKEIALEEKAISVEEHAAKTETAQAAELAKLESLEQEIKAQVAPHPLQRITFKDITKGIVGAFIGVVVHFTFTYGVELADHISTGRATFLLFFSFLIGAAFLYGTGFRKVNDKAVLWLLPYRIIVLYATAIVVTLGTLAFFYPQFWLNHDLAYRQIATVNLGAVIGACTADLIGRD